MEFYINGVEVAQETHITQAVIYDEGGNSCDAAKMVMGNVALWNSWGPKPGDRARIKEGSLDTGDMYIGALDPDEEGYCMYLTALPPDRGENLWLGYEGLTLRQILALCAREAGMDGKMAGVDGGVTYPFMMRNDQRPAAFMKRLFALEGAILKISGGTFYGVGLDYLAAMDAVLKLELEGDQPGMQHRIRGGHALKEMTVVSPYGRGTARDENAQTDKRRVITHLPAMDSGQAARWAKNLLTMHNRQGESLEISGEINPKLSALNRVDIMGTGGVEGRWIVDRAQHDLINGTTKARLLRA